MKAVRSQIINNFKICCFFFTKPNELRSTRTYFFPIEMKIWVKFKGVGNKASPSDIDCLKFHQADRFWNLSDNFSIDNNVWPVYQSNVCILATTIPHRPPKFRRQWSGMATFFKKIKRYPALFSSMRNEIVNISPITSSPLLLCGIWGDWAGGLLVVERSDGVAPDMNLRVCVMNMWIIRLPTLALKPRVDMTMCGIQQTNLFLSHETECGYVLDTLIMNGAK